MNKAGMVALIILFIFAVYMSLQIYIVETLGEWRYMLKCAKERKEIAPNDPYNNQEVQRIEEKIKKFWGNKILNKRMNYSMFDLLPTPGEEAEQPGITAKIFGSHI